LREAARNRFASSASREADETEITPEIPRGGTSLSIPTGAAAARMALDQPGVGVSSAHVKFIPCVTSSDDDEPEGSRLLSTNPMGAALSAAP